MIPSHRSFPEHADQLPSNLEFVLGLSPSAMTLGLGNIRALLARVGNPERAFRTAVIAGTNGKGSVTAMLASLLQGHGLRVGRFISPHVYSVTERVCVDAEPAGMEEMEAAAARIAPLHDEIGYSYFEAITAIAFLVFEERGVDVAVLETGLGGRFDATNVTRPDVTVITSISLDHRRILGDTLDEILREKLGITRPDVPLLLGPVGDAMERRARERGVRDGVPVVAIDEVGAVEPETDDRGGHGARIVTPRRDYGTLSLPFPGRHQLANALLAVGAAERVLGGPVRGAAASLAATYLPGRFERVERGGVTFVMDVAHNDAALCAVLDELAATTPRHEAALVFGLMRRKELFEFPDRVAGAVSRVYLVSPSGSAATSPGAHESPELLERYLFRRLTNAGVDVILWHRDAWRRLADTLTRSDGPARTVLVTGSHHVVEEFGRTLHAMEGLQ